MRTNTLEELGTIIPLSNTRNFQIENPSKYLVDIDRVIQESLTVIDKQMEKQPDEAGSIRRDPLVFSSLSRGGKTTVLIKLFGALKDKGYFVMIVSFNSVSGFSRKSHESAEEAIMRQILRQLVDPTAFSADELERLECNEQVFNTFLDQQTRYGSASEVPMIMLIDELNLLGAPLSSTASKLLQRLFLRKNRYLVFTTHFPFTLSTEEDPVDKKNAMPILSSTPDIIVVRMPQSNDLSELRKMEECSGLTGHEATIYGGIPALIYSALRNAGFFPGARFNNTMQKFVQKFPGKTRDNLLLESLLKLFLQEVFNGTRSHGDPKLRFFDQFSSIPESGKIRWPLCYLSEILNIFTITGPGVGGIIEEVYKLCKREIPAFASSMAKTGLDWQSVVDVAVLLRALKALLWKSEHPLAPSLFEVQSIEFVQMPDDHTSLEQGQQFIANLYQRQPGHLFVVRSSYAKFPLFDGFLVAVLPDNNLKVVTGYQVKLGRHTPRHPVPDWVNGGGVLLRGVAAASSSTRPNGWEFFNEDQIQEFVGYSLAPLYPACWISGVRDEELFD